MTRRRSITVVLIGLIGLLFSDVTANAGSPQWTVQPTPTPAAAQTFAAFNGIACPSPSSCTAIGNYATKGPQLPLAEAWTGVHWTIEQTPNLWGSKT